MARVIDVDIPNPRRVISVDRPNPNKVISVDLPNPNKNIFQRGRDLIDRGVQGIQDIFDPKNLTIPGDITRAGQEVSRVVDRVTGDVIRPQPPLREPSPHGDITRPTKPAYADPNMLFPTVTGGRAGDISAMQMFMPITSESQRMAGELMEEGKPIRGAAQQFITPMAVPADIAGTGAGAIGDAIGLLRDSMRIISRDMAGIGRGVPFTTKLSRALVEDRTLGKTAQDRLVPKLSAEFHKHVEAGVDPKVVRDNMFWTLASEGIRRDWIEEVVITALLFGTPLLRKFGAKKRTNKELARYYDILKDRSDLRSIRAREALEGIGGSLKALPAPTGRPVQPGVQPAGPIAGPGFIMEGEGFKRKMPVGFRKEPIELGPSFRPRAVEPRAGGPIIDVEGRVQPARPLVRERLLREAAESGRRGEVFRKAVFPEEAPERLLPSAKPGARPPKGLGAMQPVAGEGFVVEQPAGFAERFVSRKGAPRRLGLSEKEPSLELKRRLDAAAREGVEKRIREGRILRKFEQEQGQFPALPAPKVPREAPLPEKVRGPIAGKGFIVEPGRERPVGKKPAVRKQIIEKAPRKPVPKKERQIEIEKAAAAARGEEVPSAKPPVRRGKQEVFPFLKEVKKEKQVKGIQRVEQVKEQGKAVDEVMDFVSAHEPGQIGMGIEGERFVVPGGLPGPLGDKGYTMKGLWAVADKVKAGKKLTPAERKMFDGMMEIHRQMTGAPAKARPGMVVEKPSVRPKVEKQVEFKFPLEGKKLKAAAPKVSKEILEDANMGEWSVKLALEDARKGKPMQPDVQKALQGHAILGGEMRPVSDAILKERLAGISKSNKAVEAINVKARAKAKELGREKFTANEVDKLTGTSDSPGMTLDQIVNKGQSIIDSNNAFGEGLIRQNKKYNAFKAKAAAPKKPGLQEMLADEAKRKADAVKEATGKSLKQIEKAAAKEKLKAERKVLREEKRKRGLGEKGEAQAFGKPSRKVSEAELEARAARQKAKVAAIKGIKKGELTEEGIAKAVAKGSIKDVKGVDVAKEEITTKTVARGMRVGELVKEGKITKEEAQTIVAADKIRRRIKAGKAEHIISNAVRSEEELNTRIDQIKSRHKINAVDKEHLKEAMRIDIREDTKLGLYPIGKALGAGEITEPEARLLLALSKTNKALNLKSPVGDTTRFTTPTSENVRDFLRLADSLTEEETAILADVPASMAARILRTGLQQGRSIDSILDKTAGSIETLNRVGAIGGRTVRSFRNLRSKAQSIEMLRDMLKMKGISKAQRQEILRQLTLIGDPKQPSIVDKITEFGINNMLAALITLERNLVGAAAGISYQLPVKTGQALLSNVGAILGRPMTERAYLRELGPELSGMIRSVPMGVKKGFRYFAYEDTVQIMRNLEHELQVLKKTKLYTKSTPQQIAEMKLAIREATRKFKLAKKAQTEGMLLVKKQRQVLAGAKKTLQDVIRTGDDVAIKKQRMLIKKEKAKLSELLKLGTTESVRQAKLELDVARKTRVVTPSQKARIGRRKLKRVRGIKEEARDLLTEEDLTRRAEIGRLPGRAIPGKLGFVINVPVKGLVATDKALQTISGGGHRAARLMRRAIREGVPRKDIKLSRADIEAAKTDALFYVFREKLDPISGGIQKAISTVPGFPLLFPFFKSNTNFIKFAFKTSPFGAIDTLAKSVEAKALDTKAGGRALGGSAITMMLHKWIKDNNGELKGPARNASERDLLRQLNKGEMSIEWKHEGKVVRTTPFNNLAPLTIPLLVSSLVEEYHRNKARGQLDADNFREQSNRLWRGLLRQSTFSNVNDMMNAVETLGELQAAITETGDPDGEARDVGLRRWANRFVAGRTISNALREARQTGYLWGAIPVGEKDLSILSPRGLRDEMLSSFPKVSNKLLWMDKIAGLRLPKFDYDPAKDVPRRIDFTGKVAKRPERLFPIGGVLGQKPSDNIVRDKRGKPIELNPIAKHFGFTPSRNIVLNELEKFDVFPRRPPSRLTLRKLPIKLTAKEQREFNFLGEYLMEYLEATIKYDKRYRALPDLGKKERLAEIIRDFRSGQSAATKAEGIIRLLQSDEGFQQLIYGRTQGFSPFLPTK